jgi:hypothetical protein
VRLAAGVAYPLVGHIREPGPADLVREGSAGREPSCWLAWMERAWAWREVCVVARVWGWRVCGLLCLWSGG